MKLLKLFFILTVVTLLSSCTSNDSSNDKYKELAKSGTKATVLSVHPVGYIFKNNECSCIMFEDGSVKLVESEKIANLALRKGIKVIYQTYEKYGDIKLIMIDGNEENVEAPSTPVAQKDSLIIEK